MIGLSVLGKKKYALGITLLEMIFILAIINIICLISFVSYPAFSQHHQLALAANDIDAAIRYARNIAMIRSEVVVLKPLMSNWSKGMQLVTRQPGNLAKIIFQWQWHYRGVEIVWQGFQSQQSITVSPDPKQAAMNGYFLITDGAGREKKLTINRIGRVYHE